MTDKEKDIRIIKVWIEIYNEIYKLRKQYGADTAKEKEVLKVLWDILEEIERA